MAEYSLYAKPNVLSDFVLITFQMSWEVLDWERVEILSDPVLYQI